MYVEDLHVQLEIVCDQQHSPEGMITRSGSSERFSLNSPSESKVEEWAR